MKRSVSLRMGLVIGLLTGLALVAFVLPLAAQIDQQNYNPTGTGGGGSCPYCSDSLCGCTSSPNHILSYSCGCSSTDCWHSCSYQ